jgi:IS605 OrfB family transposase
VISAKLKLNTTPEQFARLRATQLVYRDSLNFVSQYAFEHGKTSNRIALHKANYGDIRARFHLPSQMACSVFIQVSATYKGLWTKVKKNAIDRRDGRTKKRYKGLDQAPKYVSPTLTYQHGKDYTFKKDNYVSVLTLEGRVIVPYTGYDKHIALIQRGAEIGAAKLWYDKSKKQFYLLVSLEIERPDPTPEDHSRVVGVDVGLRYLAVTATTTEKSQFFPGKTVRAKANHYTRLRKRLQQKGTRSATRRLVVISGRERRLKADINHTIAKRIIQRNPRSIIGLENLTDMRERAKRRKGKKASKKQRKANASSSKWSFAELHAMIAYKATLNGCMTVKVDANHTSQMCPRCGYTAKTNRPDHGLMFDCQSCHSTLHSDLVGGRNIALRTLLVRQDWMSTGELSDRPDVSDHEAKAARLQRYAELRWSPDTSLCL